jgi:Tfp pilus assembly protein PilN
MHRLELNYVPRTRYGFLIGIAALVLAAIIAAKLADVYVSVKRENIQLQGRIAQNNVRQQKRSSVVLSEAEVRQIDRANEIIDQIALPWDQLFSAIDLAAGEQIALLGISPDPKAGTVEIGGEAVNLAAMLDYVERLQRQASLTRVYLVNHKINERDPQHAVHFTVTASWIKKASEL